MSWNINILTLFPELYPGPLGLSIIGNAMKKGIWQLNASNIRDYGLGKHQTVDDTPYGGGGGMVIKPDVLGAAIEDKFIPNRMPIIYLSPRGKIFNQNMARDLINNTGGLNFVCGRYEGIDERVINEYSIVEVSIGDFVLSSGDLAAIALLDACIRLLPGVLCEHNALSEESFGASMEYQYLLEYPHYTKPYEWKGTIVPDVLASGNHKNIKKWRLEQAQLKTKQVRPDLWDQYCKAQGDQK
jgi:tRNA (guanine37-N1)-methyltransferase